ncbi:MAG: class I adenylate-forming enzyme family protein, partial [Jiangellaceae bacterium]
MNTSEWIAHLLRGDRDRPAVKYEGRMYDWGYLAGIAESLDRHLIDHGIPPGQTVGLILRERPEPVAALYGLLATTRPVLLIAPLQPDSAIADDVRGHPLAALVADRTDWARDGLAEASSATGALGLELTADPDAPIRIAVEGDPAASERYELPAGTAATLLTSGTTGVPKRIPVTYDDLDERFVDRRPSKGGVTINSLPLVSVGGFFGVVGTAVRQRPIALMDRFDVWKWAELIRDHRPRRIGAPPAVIPMLLAANIPNEYFESVELYLTASAPLDIDAADRFTERYGIPVLQGYGATEFHGAVAGWSDSDQETWGRQKRASVGRPIPGVQLKVVDPDSGEELGTDEVGRLLVWRDVATSGGRQWTATNDLARVDADGFLWIVGRTDDVIIRGGFKVQPGKVEELLSSHPGVHMAAVVGIADERLGEVPVAAVVADEDVDLDELVALTKEKLPPYQVPARITRIDEMPLNSMMKVNRHA